MKIRAVVWGENVHDRENEAVRKIYPKGMHGAIAEALNEDAGINATTATMERDLIFANAVSARNDLFRLCGLHSLIN